MRDIACRARDLILRFRHGLAIGLQLMLVVVSNRIAFQLRFDGDVPGWALVAFWQMLPLLVIIRAFTFFPLRLYEGFWRYTSFYDLQSLAGAVTGSSLLFYLVAVSPFGPPTYPRSIFIIDAGVLVLLLGGVRMARRLYAEFSLNRPGKRVLIYGAGDVAEMVVRDMRTSRQYHYYPVGFVDDDPKKLGRRIHGVAVLGARRDVPAILKKHRPDEV